MKRDIPRPLTNEELTKRVKELKDLFDSIQEKSVSKPKPKPKAKTKKPSEELEEDF